MNPAWVLRTGRLVLAPVSWEDQAELAVLKADPLVFAVMLGGVRSPVQSAADLAADMMFFAQHGYGMWTVRDRGDGGFQGVAGLMARADNRGVALRFALWPPARGAGLAREAAAAVLTFGHDHAGLTRIVAVARESNFGSRMVLGSIGMSECERFTRDGEPMLTYESVRAPRDAPDRGW